MWRGRELDLAHEEIGQPEARSREPVEQCDFGGGPSPDAADLREEHER